MKFTSPDVAWHGKCQRILSIDIHPFINQLVTGGSQQRIFNEDKSSDSMFYSGCIKFWSLPQNIQTDLSSIQCKYGMSDVTQNVNVVKYSSDGRYLAYATDNKQIVVCQIKQGFKSISDNTKTIRWHPEIRYFGHGQDVVDLAWSKNNQYIISAGMDGTVKFWTLDKKQRKQNKTITSFLKTAQGVAVHPNLQYIIAVGNDPTVKMCAPVSGTKHKNKLYDWYVKRNFQRYHFKKGVVEKQQLDPNQNQKNQSFKMFANESITSFFRRPSVSPDGQLFILPCGIWKNSISEQPKCCAYLFRKNYYSKPSFCISTNKQAVLVSKFCPLLFKKSNPQSQAQHLFKQPYYMIFAIATNQSVLIYSTQSTKPLYGMGNFHFAALTDLTWKNDTMLAVSSSDGYISFFTFEKGELGEVYQPEEGPLKEIIKRIPYVKNQQDKNQNPIKTEIQEQRIQMRETAQGIKKKIIPKIIKQD